MKEHCNEHRCEPDVGSVDMLQLPRQRWGKLKLWKIWEIEIVISVRPCNKIPCFGLGPDLESRFWTNLGKLLHKTNIPAKHTMTIRKSAQEAHAEQHSGDMEMCITD